MPTETFINLKNIKINFKNREKNEKKKIDQK